ncbi:MAG: hypothetical protein ABJC05_09735 [Pyrinomonadaceae bacterium]
MSSIAPLAKNRSPRRFARTAIAIALLVACAWAMWVSLRVGFARLRSESGQLAAVNQALQLAPNDPEGRTVRGLLLSEYGEYRDATVEFERAAELRPRDYYLWLELGMTRDALGDQDGAERALRESVRLAPYYAQPGWQLGNLLFRLGRRDEAFAELRRAAQSDPTLLPATIDLAWSALRNTEALRSVIQPQSPSEHSALARFLAKHGEGKEAVAELRITGGATREDIHNLVRDLLAQNAFSDAYEIWEYGNQIAKNASENSLTYDGGFEKPLEVNEPGFGWQVSESLAGMTLSVDASNPYQGGKSLRIDFHGDPTPTVLAISQIVLVSPKTHYRLQFAARTNDVISGGLPVVVVSDAATPGTILAESQPLASGTSPWRESVIDFTTGPQANAVVLSLRRNGCATGPCPIFGSLWLDAFFLQAIPGREVRP